MSNKTNLNFLQRFFLWCSGADHNILQQKGCLTERYKYTAIGSTVALTALMAFFSGGYALYTVFGRLGISIAGGTLWSSVIFNLDRFFILSSKRKKTDSSRAFYAASILRLFIAILLSLIVAKPLELKLFEQEINEAIKKKKNQDIQTELVKQQEEINKVRKNYSREITNIDNKLKSLNGETNQAFNKWDEVDTKARKELAGQGETGKRGRGEIFQELQNKARIFKQRYENIKKTNEEQAKSLEAEKKSIIEKREQQLQLFNQLFTQKIGEGSINKKDLENASLLERLATLEKLSNEDRTIGSINFLVTLLFITIETSPILVKILSGTGYYELMLEEKEKYEVFQEYIRNLMEKELDEVKVFSISSIEKIKEFEFELERVKLEYLKEKEKSKERMIDRASREIDFDIQEKYNQEIAMFFQICNEKIEQYKDAVKNATDKLKVSDIDEDIFK